jgi:hypothetical protein
VDPEKLKIVDVVFAFNNSALISKLLQKGKALRHGKDKDEIAVIDT